MYEEHHFIIDLAFGYTLLLHGHAHLSIDRSPHSELLIDVYQMLTDGLQKIKI